MGLGPIWDYFNHRRICRTARELGIDATSLTSFVDLSANAPIDSSGAIEWAALDSDKRNSTHFLYEGAMRNSDGVYKYFADLLTEVVAESDWVDLRSVWTKAKLKAVVSPGSIGVLTAGFRYRSAGTMQSKGPEQMRTGYYQKSGLRLEFMFDGWEITTSSSRGNLSGIWRSTAICIVRDIHQDGSRVRINATCLGIGTGFDNSYSPEPTVAHYDDTEDPYDDGPDQYDV